MKRTMMALLLCAHVSVAWAADFPGKPLRIVHPAPVGGTIDVLSRALAQDMGAAMAQPVIVEAKPGGGAIPGYDAVARAPADGYTMLLAGTQLTLNHLIRKLPYDGMGAFAPVAMLATTPNVIVVPSSARVRTLAGAIAEAKARPHGINCASASIGSGIHLALERFRSSAGIDVNYVPYPGGAPAIAAVVGGHAEMAFAPLSDAAPHIAAGTLRALAVTSLQRDPGFPDVPTLDESGFEGFEAVQWFGIAVPAGTPRAAIERISAESRRAIDSAAMRALFARMAITARPLDTAEFTRYLSREEATFAGILKRVSVKVE